jgi:Arc/MetJ family transcription regulator
METHVDIDDKLIKDAMKALGVKTEKEAIEAGLKLVNERAARERVRNRRGKVELFEGYGKS